MIWSNVSNAEKKAFELYADIESAFSDPVNNTGYVEILLNGWDYNEVRQDLIEGGYLLPSVQPHPHPHANAGDVEFRALSHAGGKGGQYWEHVPSGKARFFSFWENKDQPIRDDKFAPAGGAFNAPSNGLQHRGQVTLEDVKRDFEKNPEKWAEFERAWDGSFKSWK